MKKATARVLTSAGMTTILVAATLSASAASGAVRSTAVVIYANPANHTAYLLAFDGKTGNSVNRKPMQYVSATQSPNMLVASGGSRLYLARLTPARGNVSATNVLSLIDTHTWQTLATTRLVNRMRYTNISPPAMAVSVKTSRLFVYSYLYGNGSNQKYWLKVYNSKSLTPEAAQISLPGCGAERMATAQGQIVILCIGSQDVRFVDPRTERVTATIELPKVPPHYTAGLPTALTFSRDRRTAYVVLNDLDIVAINTQHHRTVRYVKSFRMEAGAVPVIGGADVSADGRFLVIGVTQKYYDPASGFALKFFRLPRLSLARTFQMTYAHLTAASAGGFYTFNMADYQPTAEADTEIRRLTIARTARTISLRPLLRVTGLVYAVATLPS
jgi:hypothetical protein